MMKKNDEIIKMLVKESADIHDADDTKLHNAAVKLLETYTAKDIVRWCRDLQWMDRYKKYQDAYSLCNAAFVVAMGKGLITNDMIRQ